MDAIENNTLMTHEALRPGWKEHLAALAIILGVVLLAYSRPISGDLVYYSEDTTDINYVMLRSHVEDLKEHGFIAWCPQVGTGFFRAADPTFAVHSPRIALYLLIGSYNAQVATILLYALLAGIAAYILGLLLIRSWACAVFLAIAWPLAGVMASRVSNIPYFTSAAWYPLILAAFLAVRDIKLRIPLTAVCVAMVAVEGDLLGVGVVLAALGFLALASPVQNRTKDVLSLAASAILVAGITAVIWMPAASLLEESRRGAGLPLEESLTFSMHPLRTVNLFAPRFFGQMYEQSIWKTQICNSLKGQGIWFQTVFLGLLTPLLLLAAVIRKHPQRRPAAGLVACAALLCFFAFGKWNPLMPLLMEAIPYLKTFRYPAKLFSFSSMLLLTAAAIGLREASPLLAEVSPRRKSALVASFIYGGTAIALMVWAAFAADVLKEQSLNPEISASRMIQDLVRVALFTLVIPLLILFAASLQSVRGRPLALLATGIMALDLLTALPVFSLNPRYDFFRPSKMAGLIKQSEKGRVFVDNDTYSHWKVGPRSALKYNWGVLEDISYTSGAYATVPEMLYKLDDPSTIKKHPAQVFDILSLKYIITTYEPEPKWIDRIMLSGHLRQEFSFVPQNLMVYKNTRQSPRVFVTRRFDFVPERQNALDMALSRPEDSPITFLARESAIKGGKVIRPAPRPAVVVPQYNGALQATKEILSIKEPNGDTLIIKADLKSPGILVVRDYSSAGWEAEVDGDKAVIYHADGVSRAVFLDKGKHRVKFSFRPDSLKIGAAVSISCASLALLAVVFSAVNLFRKRGVSL